MAKKIFGYFIIILILVLISQGNSFVYPKPYWLILLITILMVMAVFLKDGKLKSKILFPFYYFLIVQIYYFIMFNNFYIGFPIKILTGILIAYYFKINHLRYFVKIMGLMAGISIIFSFFTIIDFKSTFEFLKSFSLLLGLDPKFHFDGYYYTNIFIYTINQTDWFRNCGFMWEPGPFASLLSLALFLEMTFNKFKISTRLIVILTALILTFSTTGYLSLILLLIYWTVNKYDRKTRMFLIPVFISLFIFILSLPFMFDKIINLSQVNEKEIYKNVRSDRIVSLGRFNGLVLNINDMKKSPIFGVGSNKNTIGASLYKTSINGIGVTLAVYGILGFLVFTIALSKSVAYLKQVFNTKLIIIFALLIVVHSFSFTINFSLLYISLIFLYVARYNMSNILHVKT